MAINLLPKVQVEIVVSKVPVAEVIDAAKKSLYTGHIGDGKIFVYDVENAVKVRTGERATTPSRAKNKRAPDSPLLFCVPILC